MHSHIHAIGPSLVNAYSSRALEKTEVSERAAEVRKKLVGTSGEIEVEPESGGDWLVGRGYGGASHQGGRQQTGRPKKGGETGEVGDFIEAISVWA